MIVRCPLFCSEAKELTDSVEQAVTVPPELLAVRSLAFLQLEASYVLALQTESILPLISAREQFILIL